MKDKKNRYVKYTRELLISGYGPGTNREPSIALYSMTNELELNKILWKDTVPSPSFLCTYEDMCFGIHEDSEKGAVLCYQRVGNEYVLRDTLELKGGALCHITYEPLNQVLYCSFYETGHVGVIKVEHYHFTKILNLFKIKPQSENGLTRAHCCALTPDNKLALVANIALDRIYLYDIVDGKLESHKECEYLTLEEGTGPRHLKFHSINHYLYIITEYSNEIYVYSYVESNQEYSRLFQIVQKVSTLPADYHGVSTGSSIDISEDGRFLYGANRGSNTIAVYSIHSDGTLHKIQDKSCGGDCPRHISLLKDGKSLGIANQNSNEVVIIAVNIVTGRLEEEITRIPFERPSYIEEL